MNNFQLLVSINVKANNKQAMSFGNKYVEKLANFSLEQFNPNSSQQIYIVTL